MLDSVIKRLKRYQHPVADHYLRRQQAAVLLPIINGPDPALILTERAHKLTKHGGEVAFPGGKQDATDRSLFHTAQRETEEEIGLQIHDAALIAELRPFVSKFELSVTPFVVSVPPAPQYQLSEDEIASVFEVPLSWLLDDPRASTELLDRHGERHYVPEYHFDGYRIWGLTALILAEFMRSGLGLNMDLSRPPEE